MPSGVSDTSSLTPHDLSWEHQEEIWEVPGGEVGALDEG